MDCIRIREIIDNSLELKDQKQLDHVASCENCSKYYESATRIRTLFSNYTCELDDEKSEDFDNALFIKLQQSQGQIQKKAGIPKLIQIASALLSAALIFAGVIYFSSSPKTPQEELISSTYTDLNAPVRIVLEYEADRDIEGVEVAFSLDKGVRFFSENQKFSDLDSFVWKGNLKKGTNEIPFVVSVVENGSWNIMTEAGFEGMKHRHRISFETGSGSIAVTLYKLESISDKI
jgi:hypothetical protein